MRKQVTMRFSSFLINTVFVVLLVAVFWYAFSMKPASRTRSRTDEERAVEFSGGLGEANRSATRSGTTSETRGRSVSEKTLSLRINGEVRTSPIFNVDRATTATRKHKGIRHVRSYWNPYNYESDDYDNSAFDDYNSEYEHISLDTIKNRMQNINKDHQVNWVPISKKFEEHVLRKGKKFYNRINAVTSKNIGKNTSATTVANSPLTKDKTLHKNGTATQNVANTLISTITRNGATKKYAVTKTGDVNKKGNTVSKDGNAKKYGYVTKNYTVIKNGAVSKNGAEIEKGTAAVTKIDSSKNKNFLTKNGNVVKNSDISKKGKTVNKYGTSKKKYPVIENVAVTKIGDVTKNSAEIKKGTTVSKISTSKKNSPLTESGTVAINSAITKKGKTVNKDSTSKKKYPVNKNGSITKIVAITKNGAEMKNGAETKKGTTAVTKISNEKKIYPETKNGVTMINKPIAKTGVVTKNGAKTNNGVVTKNDALTKKGTVKKNGIGTKNTIANNNNNIIRKGKKETKEKKSSKNDNMNKKGDVAKTSKAKGMFQNDMKNILGALMYSVTDMQKEKGVPKHPGDKLLMRRTGEVLHDLFKNSGPFIQKIMK